ncbi:hypothetical protein [Planococcus lenghuensis]|uniref:hypothetical protein n=1 Tax=Planococcus lenghuensis TaxID=2213202 RepID=UPI002FC2C5D0
MRIGSIINGQERNEDNRTIHEVKNPFDGSTVATLALATEDDLNDAIEASHTAFEQTMKKCRRMNGRIFCGKRPICSQNGKTNSSRPSRRNPASR